MIISKIMVKWIRAANRKGSEMKEYAIWGKSPKNLDNEDLLVTKIPTKEKAKEIEKKLISHWNCFETRIQEIDFSSSLDWKAETMITT